MTDPSSTTPPPWRCYFFDAESGKTVSSDSSTPVELQDVVELMEDILDQPERGFVGLIDATGATMQFAGQKNGGVIMDVPCGALRGSWQSTLTKAECVRCVLELAGHGRIDVPNYPHLTFQKWPPVPRLYAPKEKKMTTKSNVFEALGDVNWREDPEVRIRDWRVALPLVRGGDALVFEYADYRGRTRGGTQSAIVSVMDAQGMRGDEAVLGAKSLRQLLALLTHSTLATAPLPEVPCPSEGGDADDEAVDHTSGQLRNSDVNGPAADCTSAAGKPPQPELYGALVSQLRELADTGKNDWYGNNVPGSLREAAGAIGALTSALQEKVDCTSVGGDPPQPDVKHIKELRAENENLEQERLRWQQRTKTAEAGLSWVQQELDAVAEALPTADWTGAETRAEAVAKLVAQRNAGRSAAQERSEETAGYRQRYHDRCDENEKLTLKHEVDLAWQQRAEAAEDSLEKEKVECGEALEALATIAGVNGYARGEIFPRALHADNRFAATVKEVGRLLADATDAEAWRDAAVQRADSKQALAETQATLCQEALTRATEAESALTVAQDGIGEMAEERDEGWVRVRELKIEKQSLLDAAQASLGVMTDARDHVLARANAAETERDRLVVERGALRATLDSIRDVGDPECVRWWRDSVSNKAEVYAVLKEQQNHDMCPAACNTARELLEHFATKPKTAQEPSKLDGRTNAQRNTDIANIASTPKPVCLRCGGPMPEGAAGHALGLASTADEALEDRVTDSLAVPQNERKRRPITKTGTGKPTATDLEYAAWRCQQPDIQAELDRLESLEPMWKWRCDNDACAHEYTTVRGKSRNCPECRHSLSTVVTQFYAAPVPDVELDVTVYHRELAPEEAARIYARDTGHDGSGAAPAGCVVPDGCDDYDGTGSCRGCGPTKPKPDLKPDVTGYAMGLTAEQVARLCIRGSRRDGRWGEPLAEGDVIEALAALEHERWSGWESYRSERRSVEKEADWRQLRNMAYADLTEQEKESDRVEARKTVALLKKLGLLAAREEGPREPVQVARPSASWPVPGCGKCANNHDSYCGYSMVRGHSVADGWGRFCSHYCAAPEEGSS